MGSQTENLYGLVMAGGRSRRMGRDKATLVYRGQLQIDRSYRLLSMFCERTFVSLRPDQQDITEHPQIVDRYKEIGPFGGILSAFFNHRDADWLVLSCNLPFVDTSTISKLIEMRDRDFMATLYQKPTDIEPLCTIFESAHKDKLLSAAKEGVTDLNDVFDKYDEFLNVIDPDDPTALDHVDTPDEYYAAMKRMIGG